MLPRDDGGLVRKPLFVKEDSVKTRFVFAPTASGSDPASFPSATGRPRSTPTRVPSASRSWGGRRGRSPWDKRRSKSAKTVKRPRAQLSRSQSVTYLFIPSLTRLQTRHMTDPHALPPLRPGGRLLSRSLVLIFIIGGNDFSSGRLSRLMSGKTAPFLRNL